VLASNLGLSYIAHYNAPAYFRELKEKTKFKQMVFTSFGILTALYALVMGAGYATFGDTCQGNILLNYHPSDALSTLARFATLVSILVGFPLVFCGIREGVLSILLNSGYKANFELTVRDPPRERSKRKIASGAPTPTQQPGGRGGRKDGTGERANSRRKRQQPT
jgi:amino acid permease